MSIDTSKAMRDVMTYTKGSRLGKCFTNPFAASAAITVIVLLIIYFTRGEDSYFKMGVRVFLVNLFFIYANNHVMICEFNDEKYSNDQKELLFSLKESNVAGQGEPVAPELPGAEEKDDSFVYN